MTILFGKALATRHLITILTSISFKECTKECSSRPTCSLVQYERKGSVCELHANQAANTENFVNTPGYVLVTDVEQCTNCTLNMSPRECPNPDDDISLKVLQGNQYSVGSTIMVTQNLLQPPQPLTCMNTGQWINYQRTYCLDCHDCTDFQVHGLTTPGIYFVNTTFFIHCAFELTGDAWLTFQRRIDGSVDFNRSWVDYVNGFGYMEGEFWLGLEQLHRILAAHPGQYILRVNMEAFNGTWFDATYSTFDVGDVTTNYRLTVGGYTGTAGDSLTNHSGMGFTTFDVDNKMDPVNNCSVTCAAAWWHFVCFDSSLNGEYINSGAAVDPALVGKFIHWNTITGINISLKSTRLEIRRHVI